MLSHWSALAPGGDRDQDLRPPGWWWWWSSRSQESVPLAFLLNIPLHRQTPGRCELFAGGSCLLFLVSARPARPADSQEHNTSPQTIPHCCFLVAEKLQHSGGKKQKGECLQVGKMKTTRENPLMCSAATRSRCLKYKEIIAGEKKKVCLCACVCNCLFYVTACTGSVWALSVLLSVQSGQGCLQVEYSGNIFQALLSGLFEWLQTLQVQRPWFDICKIAAASERQIHITSCFFFNKLHYSFYTFFTSLFSI